MCVWVYAKNLECSVRIFEVNGIYAKENKGVLKYSYNYFVYLSNKIDSNFSNNYDEQNSQRLARVRNLFPLVRTHIFGLLVQVGWIRQEWKGTLRRRRIQRRHNATDGILQSLGSTVQVTKGGSQNVFLVAEEFQ